MSGFIIDHHDPSLFPERWIDLAVVLLCDNKVLHERLTERSALSNLFLYIRHVECSADDKQKLSRKQIDREHNGRDHADLLIRDEGVVRRGDHSGIE